MKSVICLVLAMGLLALAGCQQSKPEDAARAFMNRQIPAHKGMDLDTSGLEYQVVQESGDAAKVLITGDIEVKAELNLIKTDGEWKVAEKGQGGEKKVAPANTGHQKAD